MQDYGCGEVWFSVGGVARTFDLNMVPEAISKMLAPTLVLLLIAHTKFSEFKYHRFSEY